MEARFDAAGVAVLVHADGVVEFDYGGLSTVSEAQAIATLEAAEAELLARGVQVPCPTLVRVGQVTRVSREARQVFAEGEINRRLASKVALLAMSPIQRMIGNFFLGLNRSARPTRLFSDVPSALVWLREES